MDLIYLLAVALDNASPNDVLLRALARLLQEKFDIQFVPANSQIRCLAHVVNLVVQKILAALGDIVDPDITDDYLPNNDAPFHYNPDNDSALQELEREVFNDNADNSAQENDEATLLAGMASEFKQMTPLQKRFRTTAERVFANELAPSGRKLASLMVIRDIRHRWNYTEAMIERGLLLRETIDIWVFEKPELRPLSLNDEHWELLDALGGLLKVTEQMSRSRTPTLPWVLPMYEGMLKYLQSAQVNTKFSCLRTAAGAGLEKLQNYYLKACNCQLNIIATLLHPSLGIAWFRKIDKERESASLLNATRTEVLFEHVYESYQKIHANNEESPTQGCDTAFPARELKRFWDAFQNYKGDRNAPLAWWKVAAYFVFIALTRTAPIQHLAVAVSFVLQPLVPHFAVSSLHSGSSIWIS
ncbi:hypothetical protein B0H13DRAFT_1917484 [Mycena leptocephala]|nr:hypothetical protein B0H13DRAFT_1917484 [Mycena leptocephala]